MSQAQSERWRKKWENEFVQWRGKVRSCWLSTKLWGDGARQRAGWKSAKREEGLQVDALTYSMSIRVSGSLHRRWKVAVQRERNRLSLTQGFTQRSEVRSLRSDSADWVERALTTLDPHRQLKGLRVKGWRLWITADLFGDRLSTKVKGMNDTVTLHLGSGLGVCGSFFLLQVWMNYSI